MFLYFQAGGGGEVYTQIPDQPPERPTSKPLPNHKAADTKTWGGGTPPKGVFNRTQELGAMGRNENFTADIGCSFMPKQGFSLLDPINRPWDPFRSIVLENWVRWDVTRASQRV